MRGCRCRTIAIVVVRRVMGRIGPGRKEWPLQWPPERATEGVPYPKNTLERLCSKYKDLINSPVSFRIHRPPQSKNN